jgi:hypothetical protein
MSMSRRLIWFIVGAMLCPLSHSMAQDFPNGPGKDVVISNCGRCHDLARITTGHSAEGWQSIVHKMQGLGAGLPEDQMRTVTEYLAKNFPEKEGPAPAQITQSNGPINLPQVCDQRGVCCMGEREACFGADPPR